MKERGFTTKMFIDSANVEEIEEAFKRGSAGGGTTNPSVLSREKKWDFQQHIAKIIDIIRRAARFWGRSCN